MLSIVLLSSVLTACHSVRPHYHASEEAMVSRVHNCEDVRHQLTIAERKRVSLENQKSGAYASNAANSGMALLSLNPVALLTLSRTGEVDEAITSYESRIAELKAKEQAVCTNPSAAVSAVAPTVNSTNNAISVKP